MWDKFSKITSEVMWVKQLMLADKPLVLLLQTNVYFLNNLNIEKTSTEAL